MWRSTACWRWYPGPGLEPWTSSVARTLLLSLSRPVPGQAEEFGVRLIIPFVNANWIQAWGSVTQYAAWRGHRAGDPQHTEFFHSAEQRALFESVVRRVLTRRNTVTGREYRDEVAVLAWELGNELHDVRYGAQAQALETPPPVAWTNGMADFIRGIDSNHMILDGAQFSPVALSLSPNVSLVGRTYYGELLSGCPLRLQAWHAL